MWGRHGWPNLVVLALALAGQLLAPAAGARLQQQPVAARLVIDEIAWAGTAASSSDEWIELYNPGSEPLELAGWRLDAADGAPTISLAGVIAPGEYYLLERTDDSTVSDVPADLIYAGALGNGGEQLALIDPSGSVVDTANGDGGGWPAGSSSPDYLSMERTNPQAADSDANWHSNNDLARNGHDANGNPISGTPRQANSPLPPPTTATVGGYVFEDLDGDGRYEPWAGEAGIANVLVAMSDGRTRLTAQDGFYGWRNVPPGQYTLRQAQPIHTASTTPDEVAITLAAGDEHYDVNFGEVFLPADQVHTALSLNEFLPSPASDWDGNGDANAEDEWIELYNASDQPLDLAGWFLDDGDDGQASAASSEPAGSQPYLIPPGTSVAAHGFLVFYRGATAVALNNDGDTLRLLGPGLYEAEARVYGSTSYDISWSKAVDGGADWVDSYPPSPGSSNQPPPSPTPTPTPTSGPTATPYPSGISLNEFLPDPASDWNGDGTANLDDEYIELFNANSFAVDLSGWLLDDVDDGAAAGKARPAGVAPYPLPAGTSIPANGFLVLFRSQSGVALNNEGDWVRLLRPDRTVAEAIEYTASRDDEAYSKTTDGGAEWTRSYPPSPGSTNTPAGTPTATPTASVTGTVTATTTGTVTATPTATASATPTATPAVNPSGLSLNEYLPDPASDWDGDGAASQEDEYIELFNANDEAIDLGGWRLDDVDDGGALFGLSSLFGSAPYIIPPGTVIPAHGFLAFFRSQTNLALNNDGDWVRLLRPDGLVVEQVQYATSHDDEAYSKIVDGGSEWTPSYPPSPGGSNTPGGTPTPTLTPTASATPTATPGGTPTPFPAGVGLNEFLPRPASDWNGDGQANADDEYVELFNAADRAADLGGWLLDDAAGGSQPYRIPDGVAIAASGFLVLYRSQTGVALNDTGGDSVRLLSPGGVEVEQHDYDDARPDVAFSKMTDGGNIWSTSYPPSPGTSNRPAYTPDDVIRLNEVLPSPRDVDWDGDGQASYLDEWIELVNAGQTTVALGGWKLSNDPPPAAPFLRGLSGYAYTLPAGTILAPGQFLLVFRRQSGLALDASDEWVRLLYPDDVQADALYTDRFSGYDHAWCRLPDGAGEWTLDCLETPGLANASGSGGDDGGSGDSGGDGSAPPYDRFNYNLATVATARGLPDETRVTIEGQVTVLPNVLDERQIYIQDATGGILVYLRSAQWPALSEGQWLRVNGRLDTFHSEREVRLTRIDDIKTLGPGTSPLPASIRSGEVAEANEGRLVQLVAPATGFWGDSTLYFDDGSGEARVTIYESTGMRRPYVNLGELWTVVGVVSQWDDDPPYDDGYRILPRRPADLQRGRVAWANLDAPPLFLPETGEAKGPALAPPHGMSLPARLAIVLAAALLGVGLDLRGRSKR